MKALFKRETRFATLLIICLASIFILAALMKVGISFGIINKYEKSTSIYAIDIVAKKIKDMNHIDAAVKDEITQVIDEFNSQNNNGLYHVNITRHKQASYIEYKYDKDEPKNFLSKAFEGGNGWYISYNISEAQAENDYSKQKNVLYERLGTISNYLFFISAVFLLVIVVNRMVYKKINY